MANVTHAGELAHRIELALLRRNANRLRDEVRRRLARWSSAAARLDQTCAGKPLDDALVAEAFTLRTELSRAIRRFARTLKVLDAALGSHRAE
jgi:hypothetical protein